MSSSASSTFEELLADLSRDVLRAQPRDALQFCANWFQARLQEQRARVRDALQPSDAPVPSRSASLQSLLADDALFQDRPIASPRLPQSTSNASANRGSSPSPLQRVNSPNRPQFGQLATSAGPRRPQNGMPAPSPFGTLNIPGNAAIRHSPFQPLREDEELTDMSSPALRRAPSNEAFLGPPASALGRRVSVSAESIDPSARRDETPLPFFEKTPEQMKRLEASIANAFLFRNLDQRKRHAVLGAMREMTFGEDVRVITQGDDGDYFYVVDSGTLLCYVHYKPGERPAEGDHPQYGKKVFTYTNGTTFGELALMYHAQRAATVITATPCTLWALDRVTFQTILLDISNRTRKSYEGFLRSVPILQSLNDQERAKLADVLQAREFDDGETVVVQGDIGREFYIIEDGEAVVSKRISGADDEMREETVSTLKKGDYFGELALLHRAPRAATVRAAARSSPTSGQKLKVVALDSDAFTRLLGPLREIMERTAEINYQPRAAR
ncbi:hypothetical protein BOTBODRAFT_39147 [Botryobasidium botryosum FD-172 SS1]|uniref:cAMP-dependent protein kinase regulatory subunit n=1 Tax=Botryobasidium botryosum (strain FD-172 SS1) TaxID=930990 RepID=A0A067LV55_BOTB1|nr:hypothetical protein BOTBODRAFT_39147 [Botryobasidium botryosum FD-172 SS1]